MKKIRIKWFEWTAKVLATLLSMLGFLSCGIIHKPQPLMYSVPSPEWDSSGSVIVLMYGIPDAEYVDTDSVHPDSPDAQQSNPSVEVVNEEEKLHAEGKE